MSIVRALVALGAALSPVLSFAGTVCGPVPAPLAGALGPVGLAVAGVGYVGYRIFKNRNK